jgi:putative ATP-binding cassette transporter
LLRVASFRRAVLGTDVLHDVESQIAFVEGEPGALVIDHLEIASQGGCTKLEELHVSVRAGERVLIVGQAGTGKTLLFRALAGLWPWGAGRIALPIGETMVCIPRTAYLPPGTLREVLAYPSPVAKFAPEAFAHALERLGLDRLVPLLDQTRRWEQLLSDAEQQSVAFARALIHAPPWLLIDEVLDTLDDDLRRKVSDVIAKDLAGSAVIHIGRSAAHGDLFGRVLHLVKDPEARRLPSVGNLARSRPVLTAS